MPRPIDVHARRLEITNAAIRILARGGTSALTLKSLAVELGGSITLVTHFFANRKELFVAVTDELIASYDLLMEELDQRLTGYDRLYAVLMVITPTTPGDIESEAGRVALIPHRGEHESIEHFFQAMELRMRSLLRDRLQGLVPDDDLEEAVLYLRAVTNGLTLSAVEHPEIWTADRIEASLRTALRGLDLGQEMQAPERGAR